jgi:hypothetical protein
VPSLEFYPRSTLSSCTARLWWWDGAKRGPERRVMGRCAAHRSPPIFSRPRLRLLSCWLSTSTASSTLTSGTASPGTRSLPDELAALANPIRPVAFLCLPSRSLQPLMQPNLICCCRVHRQRQHRWGRWTSLGVGGKDPKLPPGWQCLPEATN